MKITITYLIAAAGLSVALPGTRAAEDQPAPREEKKQLRVLTPERRGMIQRERERNEPVEKETVAFLGVETSPVSATTGVQLGLPRGTGLVVSHVLANSPAASVLKEHDILLRLDDQILIETRQLLVLIRNHKEGDDVTLTYLRGGQKATASLKLGKTEVPKTTTMFGPGMLPFGGAPGTNRFEYFVPGPGVDGERAGVDHLLSMMQRSPSGEPIRIQIDRNLRPGFRAMTVHTGNSNIVFSDDEGSLELTTKDGAKTLVAKNAKGDELFSGPVNTPEERQAMPPGVRGRLEKLEGMHDMTFHTDEDFKGTEMKMIHPRGINLPVPREQPQQPPPQPAFY
jgi:hypothetical protein